MLKQINIDFSKEGEQNDSADKFINMEVSEYSKSQKNFIPFKVTSVESLIREENFLIMPIFSSIFFKSESSKINFLVVVKVDDDKPFTFEENKVLSVKKYFFIFVKQTS